MASGTATAEEGGIVGDIDAALDVVEADGFDATGMRRSARCAGCCAARATPTASAWPT